jgi:hypothetical protein
MKKVFILSLCLIIFIPSSLTFSEASADKLTPRAPKAEMWDRFDMAFKSVLIGGLLVGYREGIATGAASELRRLKNNSVKSTSEADQLKSRAQVIFDNPVSFYVEQADHFMKTFPVCKKMQLTQLLAHLVSVWAASPLKGQMGYEFMQEINYEFIAEACKEVQKEKEIDE